MDYLYIVDLVFTILYLFFGALFLHFVLFAVVGLFKRKKFPKTDEKLKYGIIIPARNEEAVVGNLIKSVYKNKYPQDKLQVFVIAHNCTDKTAEIAEELGATVYKYDNPKECTMGYAFKYLFDRIKEDWGTENYDGFFLFNADNVLAEDYFDKMNDAFVANGKTSVVTSFRNSKNFGSNVISAMYGIYFMQGCRFESRGRTVCGCSTRVQGTGYVINSNVVKDGWPYVTLTEDWEFSADQIIRDNKIVYCDEAVFYDEQPTNVKIMIRQRLRWAKGHLLVCLTRYRDLLKSFFTPKRKGGAKHKFSVYDMSVNILPICIIYFVLAFIKTLFVTVTMWLNYSPAGVWIDWAIGVGKSAAMFYAVNFLTGIVLIIAEHKRVKRTNFFVLMGALLLWPIFLLLSAPLEVLSMFMKVGWKTIPHDDETTFEKVNGIEEGCLEQTDAPKEDENEVTDDKTVEDVNSEDSALDDLQE